MRADALLAAALAERLRREGQGCAGLVLLDPVDWRRLDYFVERASAADGQVPDRLRQVAALQLAALRDFAPGPLVEPTLCLDAASRDAGWPDADAAWAGILRGEHVFHRIDGDHWSMLSQPELVASVAARVTTFAQSHAARKDRVAD